VAEGAEPAERLRVLLLGHGRMGRLVELLADEYACDIADTLDSRSNANGSALASNRWRDVDVAIDFTHGEALAANLRPLCALGANLVIGTTGWREHESDARRLIEEAQLGAVVAANFSVGANVVEAVAELTGRLFEARQDYGAWIHEMHHAAKRDAPSGTARTMSAAVTRGGFTRSIDMASTRAGMIPGTHTLGFDGPDESVSVTHLVRDRATFARGALQAARWVKGRRGWFTMRDVLGI
jgi:4-hydroxy-tetrahydrodipicolinate reductase